MSGSVFMPTSISPSLSEPDPTKHVNYVLGMVLGVDDFTQEFAYLSGRDELAARELGGSGVARGLRVTSPVPPDAVKGPEVVVSAGIAVTPRGELVRVPLTQCAYLNEWISRNIAALKAHGLAPTVAVPATASLFVVLSYAERTTDLVPIPGEPCRTEDESLAASRVTDDFKLEIRLDPPEQREQEAILAYLDWLATVPVVDAAGTQLPAFLAAIEDAAGKTPQVAIAPSTTPIFAAPPPAVTIPRSEAARYYREAIRLHATLRAAWQGVGASADGTPPTEGGVLLAEVRVPIIVDAIDAAVWKVQSAGTIVIDEGRRSRVLSLGYLQEVLFALADRTSKSAVTHPQAPGLRYLLAAAGTVTIKAHENDAPPEGSAPTYNGLTAWQGANPGEVLVKFNGPNGPGIQYVVKALPVVGASPTFNDPTVSFGAFQPSGSLIAGDAPRFLLRVNNGGAAVPQAALALQKLMIEVSVFGAG